MKVSTLSKFIRLTLFAGWAAFLFTVVGGWKRVSDMMVDNVSAAMAATAMTAMLVCFWAMSGRPSEEHRNLGPLGAGLLKRNSDVRLGMFVRILCGLVALITSVAAIGIIAAVTVALFRQASLEKMQAEPLWVWPAMFGCVIMCAGFAIPFGYLAFGGLWKGRRKKQ